MKRTAMTLLLGALLLAGTGCAKKEIVDIKPNEVAYEVNNFATSKGDKSQKFDNTREGWGEIKSSSKMIIVPIVKVKTGAVVGSRRIPEKKIIVVSQGIVSKEWVSSVTKGSNKRDDSFTAESKNGAEFHTGITLSAKIVDTDTYLSIYGIDPNAGLNDAKVESMSLSNVLDTQVKSYILGELNAEFSKIETFGIQPNKNAVVQRVEAKTRERFAKDGIQILTFNSSENVTWKDSGIQTAINEKARLEAQHQKAIVEQSVKQKEAETKRLVLEQENMSKARAMELHAEAQKREAELNRIKQEEVNKGLIDKAEADVKIAKLKASVVSTEKALLEIEKEKAEIDVLRINAQANLEEAKKWNGVREFSNASIIGASSVVGQDGSVKTLNLVK
ncbi:MAG: SPFH domain-containing protein [Cellulosilyticaceae bacterium]